MTTPENLVAFITSAQAQIKATQADIDAWKAELQALYDNGSITDKLSTPYGSASLTQRTTYAYSQAVEDLKGLERIEGIATKKLTTSWTIRPATPEQLDF